MKISLAQYNFHVGNIFSNRKKIEEGIRLAEKKDIDIEISGLKALPIFTFKSQHHQAYKTYISQEMLKRGFLASNSIYVCVEHNETIVDNYCNELDIIFLPCVCFDSKGNRIGMGGGFYDKTLDQLSNNQKPQLILLAYDFQEVESCFPESHDIKADACLTPNKFLKF